MKLSEIRIGEFYLLGWNSKVEVLEKGVERTTRTGTIRRDGVRVICREYGGYLSPAEGEEEVVTSANLKQTWSDWQEEKKIQTLREEIMQKENEQAREKMSQLEDEMARHGIPLGHSSIIQRYGADNLECSIRIDIQSVQKLLLLLQDKPVQPNDSTSSSALGKVFGDKD